MERVDKVQTIISINKYQLKDFLKQIQVYKPIYISKINEKYYRINLSNLIDNDLLILIN